MDDSLSKSLIDISAMKECLEKAEKEFQFICEKDHRLATLDYAKYKAAYSAFRIAHRAIEHIVDMGEPGGSGDTRMEPFESATPANTLIEALKELQRNNPDETHVSFDQVYAYIEHFGNTSEIREDSEPSMNALLKIIGDACIKHKGVMTWEEGLRALRMQCRISWLSEGKPVSLKDGATVIEEVMAQAVKEPAKHRARRAAEACSKAWGLLHVD